MPPALSPYEAFPCGSKTASPMSTTPSNLLGSASDLLNPIHAQALSRCRRNDLVLRRCVKTGTAEMHRIILVYHQLVVVQDVEHSNWPKAGCWSLTGNDCSYIEDEINIPCPHERLPYCLDTIMKPGDTLHICPSGRRVRRLLFSSKCPLNSCYGGFTCLGSRNVLSGFTRLQSNLGPGCKLPKVCCPVCFGYDFAIKDRERIEENSKLIRVSELAQPLSARNPAIRQRAPGNMQLIEEKKSKEEEEGIFIRQGLIKERASELGLAVPKFEENPDRRWHILHCTIHDKPTKSESSIKSLISTRCGCRDLLTCL